MAKKSSKPTKRTVPPPPKAKRGRPFIPNSGKGTSLGPEMPNPAMSKGMENLNPPKGKGKGKKKKKLPPKY